MSQVFSTFAVLSRKESIDAQFRKLGYNARQEYAHTVARMAESVDALVSNTSAARHAGSIPAPGTTTKRLWQSVVCQSLFCLYRNPMYRCRPLKNAKMRMTSPTNL